MKEIKQLLYELGLSSKFVNMVPTIIDVVLILIIGFIVIKIILRVTRKAMEKSSLDPVLYRFIQTMIKIILYIVLVLTVLAKFNVQMTSLLTVLAAAGAAVALALKDSLGNVAGGIMILINKPFTQDDYIDINGTTGKVRDIDLFVTHLKTFDNKVITIPNGMVTTSVLTNSTKENKRRVDCCFSIGYHDDIQKAKDILAAISETNPAIFRDPEPIIGVAGQRENSIDLDLKVWCDTDDYWDVKYFLEENVKLAFDEAGITIPYPQMDVHLKK